MNLLRLIWADWLCKKRDIIKGLAQHSMNGLADVHHEFDYLFWMGDLNYRIELPRDEIIERIGRSGTTSHL